MFEQTFKNFNINLNALNERNSYSSGELMTGQISFVLSKETKINSITLSLKGIAKVHWSTGGGGGKRGSKRKHFSAKLEFFNLKRIILQEDGAVGVPAKLPSGTHVYPFTCQIPQGDFPSSFRGVHGEIVYTLTVGIKRPWHLTKDYTTEFNFTKRIDNNPELLAPLAGSNCMMLCCLWCASGPISMSGRLEKKGFVPGENVKIICKFSNASSRTATPKVLLSQKQMFYTHNKTSKRMHLKQLASVTGQPIRPHSSDVYSEIMLTIPPIVALTISNCSIIEVDYLIEVRLCIKASSDLIVLFPIVMCDSPPYTAPPQYL
ncbi:arrestin domain-containing protein 3-like [Polymixia lowei]